jgi:hypothetical protein
VYEIRCGTTIFKPSAGLYGGICPGDCGRVLDVCSSPPAGRSGLSVGPSACIANIRSHCDSWIYLSEEKDEFVRTVLVKSSLWATGFVLAFATFWGFLQSYAPAINRTVNFPMYCVFIVWWVSFGLAEPLVRRTYK